MRPSAIGLAKMENFHLSATATASGVKWNGRSGASSAKARRQIQSEQDSVGLHKLDGVVFVAFGDLKSLPRDYFADNLRLARCHAVLGTSD